jgi:hypothetical protein
MLTDNTTFITTTGLVFTLCMGLLLLVLPKRYALMPIFALIFFMTMGERVLIGGLNFTMIRILLLFGWVRLAIRREIRPLKFNPIDIAIVLWIVSGLILHNVLWQTGAEFQNSLGGAYDKVGTYFLLRFLVRDVQDIPRIIKSLAIFIVPLGALMLNEKLTGRNMFFAFGGVPEFTVVREGALRCQGPFGHPILAGSFGAALMPFFIALYRDSKWLALLGIVSSATVVITSASSGPVGACLFGILGLCMWPLRRSMRKIRWGIGITLVSLHLVMKSPVWFLMARADIFAGSTGYHRALLIDQAVHHLNEWWLCGTKETASWGGHLEDVTNQYIQEGVTGGLLTMAFFILVVTRCFAGVGFAVRTLEGSSQASPHIAFYIWSLGAALLVHTVTFLSVSYFDQNAISWYLLLAMISSVYSAALVMRKHRVAAALPTLQLEGVGLPELSCGKI